MQMKRLTILGSSGSIGQNCLDIVRKNPDKLSVRFLTVHQNIDLLVKQIEEFKPEAVVVTNESAFEEAKRKIRSCKLLLGDEELIRIAGESVELCINALVGASGVRPSLKAIEHKIDIALANKESLVTAGLVIMEKAKQNQVKIFPIDSEHSAIWQCLVGENPDDIRNIILTASGGPFRGKSYSELKNATIKEALAHPNWSMGSKITIDSATLMNKGFEVIETYWLYPVEIEQIKVVIHPQSIIHSFVEFHDGSFKAQLGVPDMRVPIQYAISYPKRWKLQVEELDLVTLSKLTFEDVDLKSFKCLRLAYEALRENGTLPAVLNAVNELTNRAFLDGKISFTDIADINEDIMEKHQVIHKASIDDILAADSWAREYARNIIQRGKNGS